MQNSIETSEKQEPDQGLRKALLAMIVGIVVLVIVFGILYWIAKRQTNLTTTTRTILISVFIMTMLLVGVIGLFFTFQEKKELSTFLASILVLWNAALISAAVGFIIYLVYQYTIIPTVYVPLTADLTSDSAWQGRQ